MRMRTGLEAGANLATIVLVFLFGWVALHGGKPKEPEAGTAESIGPKVGAALGSGPLKNINWAQNGRTLVLGLQTSCHFCTESGPFLQKLLGAAAGSTRIVAVLPQPVSESEEYLARLGVRVDEIRSLPLSSLGVNGTPTLLLVDSKGTIQNVWIGKLASSREAEVLSAIAPGPR
jgi:hypothetical protein